MSKGEEKQELIYDYIRRFILERAYPPTVREIGAAVGLRSTSSVHAHLHSLAERGLITIDPQKQRSITISESDYSRASYTRVAHVGRVAAGLPILAHENITEYYLMPPSLLHGADESEVFMLSVYGESMIEAGINNGDIIIVRKQDECENGDIVVVRVDSDTVTVKRFYKEKGGRVRLQPENSTMQPIIVSAGDVELVGKVIGLYRKY